jgi:prepilin-type N-terminal cleavage/methylation domain-containing protein
MRHVVGTSRGLTLVELMIVLAVSGLLLGGTWQLYHSSLQAYRHGLQEVRIALGARMVLRLMTGDIQNALASAVPYGIQESHLPHTSAAHADRLALTTAAYPPPGVQTIQYYLEPTTGEGHLTLKRALLIGEDRTIQRVMPLSERLYGLHVRYFDGQVWYDSWQRADLPRALEITVLFQDTGPTARVHRFTTMVVME